MKKLKLRKEVKFITASIALGLTLCAVPTMKVIAEDDSVDTSELYTRLMAAETLEEFEEIADSATDDQYMSISEEQLIDIDDHFDQLILDIYENNTDNTAQVLLTDDEETTPSEIIYPTIDFVNVAPLVNYIGNE